MYAEEKESAVPREKLEEERRREKEEKTEKDKGLEEKIP